MNAEEKAKWSEMRAKGKGRFILFQGVFKIGPLFAVGKLISNYCFKYGFIVSQVTDYLRAGETIFNFFLDWLYFGLGLGLLYWYFNEREFKKAEKNER